MSWKVEYYQSSRGEFPVKEFIDSLDERLGLKVKAGIAMLVKYGPFIKPPYIKKLFPNLYELRIKTKIAVRVFYSPKTGIYYLLHAFIKKTNKTPIKELKIGLDRMRELI